MSKRRFSEASYADGRACVARDRDETWNTAPRHHELRNERRPATESPDAAHAPTAAPRVSKALNVCAHCERTLPKGIRCDAIYCNTSCRVLAHLGRKRPRHSPAAPVLSSQSKGVKNGKG